MIENIPELQEVTRSEVVVGELEIEAPKFRVVASFATHVAIQ
jgi:hypothetical protein